LQIANAYFVFWVSGFKKIVDFVIKIDIDIQAVWIISATYTLELSFQGIGPRRLL